jgi:hypothetical protein
VPRARLTRADQAALAAWQTSRLHGLLEVVATLRRRVRCPACRGTGRGILAHGERARGQSATRGGSLHQWLKRHRTWGQHQPRLNGPRLLVVCGVCENRSTRPGFISPDAARWLLHEVALLEATLNA